MFNCSTPASSDEPAGAGASGKETAVRLQNEAVRLEIDSYGGAFTEFVNLANPVNPLTWALSDEQMPENNQDGAPFKGHFLCLGRWGSPSPGEIEAGIPHNGEQSNTMWEIVEQSEEAVVMTNEAPLDGLSIRREVEMATGDPAFTVTETIRNTGSLGRASNVVQHVTLGPPFLSGEMTVQTNAAKGFNQKFAYPDPHRYEYVWPEGFMDTIGTKANLRQTSLEHNYVTTHIFDPADTFGWVMAYNPREGLLLGYVWRLEDYPWLNIWNHHQDGEPVAKGLEFGTTGIGRPYRDLLETDTRFHGRNSWEYLDAGEEVEKSFLGFILDVGENVEIGDLRVTAEEIEVPVSATGVEEQVFRIDNAL